MQEKSPYNFDNYHALKPSHKKTESSVNKSDSNAPTGSTTAKHETGEENNHFLEWFIGFSEGDGSFGAKDGYPAFVINQADLGVLNLIQTSLGMGRVSTFVQEGSTYGRLFIGGQDKIEMLIHIFNGNIHLDKVHGRFTKWVNFYNKVYGKNITVLPKLEPSKLSLKTAWASGFFDAEGCCYGGFTHNERMRNKVRLRLKATFDQKAEFAVLDRIRALFLVKSVTTRPSRSGMVNHNQRVEITSAATLILLVQYLEVFKLKTRKRYAYSVWKPLVVAYKKRTHLNLSTEGVIEATAKIQEYNQSFKKAKNVVTLFRNEFENF